MIPLPLVGPVAYLLDLSSLARGLFETLPPASSEEGEPIAVTAAVALRLVRILAHHRPHFLAIAADPDGAETGEEEDPAAARQARYWRAGVWADYKAGRVPPGPEYDTQIARLIEIAQAHRIPVHRRAGMEADDWIGILAPKLARLGLRVVIVSKDHDLWQLLRGEQIVAWDGTSTEATTEADVVARYGVAPALLPVVMALAGDADEAPGLPGIGDKGAATLVGKHLLASGEPLGAAGMLDRILARWQWETTAKGQPSKIGRALRDGGPAARLSLRLVELREDVAPVVLDLAEMRTGWSADDASRVRALGEVVDVAVLRNCPPRPKPALPEALVKRWLEAEAEEVGA